MPMIQSLPVVPSLSPRDRWNTALPLDAFVAHAEMNQKLWAMTLQRARLTEAHSARAAAIPGTWHLLVLLEDWCGDAVNSVPYVQRIADANPAITVRVIQRDAHLDLMDEHLTNGARAIPIVLLYDAQFTLHGVWGSRPAALQRWVLDHGMALDKEARYKEVRTWYVRDRGATVVNELLTRLEHAAIR